MVNNNSNSDVIKIVASPGELVTISERYSVEDDGIYHIREEVREVGNLASKRLVMPKDTFIEAFKKIYGRYIIMSEYYIVREFNDKGETCRYHLQSHSELTKDAKLVSRWYAYPKKTTAESLAKRLQKADKTGHFFECVTCSSQGIEVK